MRARNQNTLASLLNLLAEGSVYNAIRNYESAYNFCMSQNIVDLCNSNNLKVVAADDALEANGTKLVPWVGISGKVIGESVGQWVCDYIKANSLDKDTTTGLLMMTMNTVSSCVPRTDGESEIIYKNYPDYQTNGLMFTVDYDGTTEKGNTQSAAIFTGHPEIKKWIVFGANEEGVVGAVRALETAGLDKDSVAVGMPAERFCCPTPEPSARTRCSSAASPPVLTRRN